MRALTLHQPWAWAIAHSTKRLENRTWAPPPSLVGKYLAIHAGAEPRSRADRERCSDICAELGAEESKLVFGAIVAVARVTGSRQSAPDFGDPQLEWWAGPVAWALDDVVALPSPVPCKGAQLLWTVAADDLALVRLQWKLARGRELSYEDEERLALADPRTN